MSAIVADICEFLAEQPEMQHRIFEMTVGKVLFMTLDLYHCLHTCKSLSTLSNFNCHLL